MGTSLGGIVLSRGVLVFLFPLVHRLVGIAQTLSMAREKEVRSSELETGLASSEEHGAPRSLLCLLLTRLGVYVVL